MTDLSGARVLVTGADGFIGSHLTEALVRAGADVRAFIYYNSLGSLGWLDHAAADVAGRFEAFPGDIRDYERVRAAMDGREVVFHLAALIAIPYSYGAAESYVDTNVRGTLNVVRAATEAGASRVIHTSTSEVYGTAVEVPITEEHRLNAQSPYAATKIGADQIALSYHASFATPVTVVRPFNTYGPRQSARAVIPTIITQIAAGADEIRLGATHPTRDFSFVADTVSGFLAVATAGGTEGEVLNLGSGFEISIGETAELIAETMGRKVSIRTEEQRVRPDKSEVERLWASIEKVGRLVGWTPEYGGREGFRRGLQATIDWFGDAANLRRYRAHEYQV